MSIFSKFFNWIKGFIFNIPKEVREAAEVALKVTAILKDIAVDQWDKIEDLLGDIPKKEIILFALDKAAQLFGLATKKDLFHYLNTVSPTLKRSGLIKIASIIIAQLDNEESKENQYDLAAQAVMSSQKADVA